MTEQPPVTPDNPTDSGTENPPTDTENAEQATQQDVQIQTPLSPADHELYSQPLYGQPAFVINAVFASGKLDPNAGPYTQAQVQGAIDSMMQETDKTFQEETP